jgi:D-serine dehydratase
VADGDWGATRVDEDAVAALGAEALDWRYKGAPFESMTLAELRSAGLRLLDGDLPLPVLTLRQSALRNNVERMQQYCVERDVLLAPHGKTTMAPQLLAEQVRAGAWAVTCATPSQLRVYRRFGVGRVVYANELAERSAIAWIAEELGRDERFELFCLVDSVAGVALLDDVLRAHPLPRALPVLLELGYEGGRTGCRSHDDVVRVVDAVRDTRTLQLVGIEGFEGLLRGADLPETLARVDAFLERLTRELELLVEAGALAEPAIVSVGGSAFFDRVLEAFDCLRGRADLRFVLRSGCYVTQDGGYYHDISPLGGRAPGGVSKLENALELWSVVLSRPEPTRAIASFGKRDAPIDLGLPQPVALYRDGRAFVDVALRCSVEVLNDQHAHLRVDETLDVAPGDVLASTVSHPCTAFDKWKLIPVVDDENVVVDGVLTFF